MLEVIAPQGFGTMADVHPYDVTVVNAVFLQHGRRIRPGIKVGELRDNALPLEERIAKSRESSAKIRLTAKHQWTGEIRGSGIPFRPRGDGKRQVSKRPKQDWITNYSFA